MRCASRREFAWPPCDDETSLGERSHVGALTLASNNPSPHSADPKKGGVLAYATVSGPGGLDPHVSSSAVELEVIHNVFEPLVTLDNQNATKTMLAASASASAGRQDLHI